jgi:hypothetical protein
MAPMAGRVADVHQDGFVFFACSRQSLWAPGIPIHGVVRVLQEVRTLGMEQSICGHGNYWLNPERLVLQSGFYVLDFFIKINFTLHSFEFA